MIFIASCTHVKMMFVVLLLENFVSATMFPEVGKLGNIIGNKMFPKQYLLAQSLTHKTLFGFEWALVVISLFLL